MEYSKCLVCQHEINEDDIIVQCCPTCQAFAHNLCLFYPINRCSLCHVIFDEEQWEVEQRELNEIYEENMNDDRLVHLSEDDSRSDSDSDSEQEDSNYDPDEDN